MCICVHHNSGTTTLRNMNQHTEVTSSFRAIIVEVRENVLPLQKRVVKSARCCRSGADTSSLKSDSGGNHLVDCLFLMEFPWSCRPVYVTLADRHDYQRFCKCPVHDVYVGTQLLLKRHGLSVYVPELIVSGLFLLHLFFLV